MSKLSRRSFMASAAAAGAAMSFPTAAKAGMAIDDVNLGFIACGGRAGQHMGAFSKLDGVKIAAVCDPDEGRMGKAASKYKAKGYACLLYTSPSPRDS